MKEKVDLRSKHLARVQVALAYPNTYQVGTANLGFQTVYRLLNEFEGVSCERVFLPQGEEPLRPMESGQPLKDCDVLAFSVSFELDYLNLLRMLDRAGIPLLSSQRGEEFPLVMVGGVCAFLNPEPLAPFVDLFVVGEAEEILPELLGPIWDWVTGEISKEEMLLQLAHVSGIYVPRFYRPSYGDGGQLVAVEPVQDVPPRIERKWASDLDLFPIFSPVLPPEGHFREALLLEVGRGCPRGCRFCAAAHVYRPFRYRSVESLISIVDREGKGAKRVGLVGSALSDYPHLEELSKALVERGYGLTFSSLRADTLSEGLVKVLVRGGGQTVTLAPETGSEELREAIHKNLSDEEILRAVALVAESGVKNLRLYFMVGLPGEGEQDLRAIVSLVGKIRRIFDSHSPRRQGGRITVSLNPFVPKASTPFQWCPMEGEKSLSAKLRLIVQGLRRIAGVRITGENPRMAVLQGMLSQGDRRVGMALVSKYWNNVTWKQAWRAAKVNPEEIILRVKPFEQVFPWDLLEVGVSREYLWREYQRALRGLGVGYAAF